MSAEASVGGAIAISYNRFVELMNLAITSDRINLAISAWFSRPQSGTGEIKVRDFVIDKSRQEQRFWGEQAIAAMGRKIVEKDFGRGRFQELDPK